MERNTDDLRLPKHLEPTLERVLAGKEPCRIVQTLFGVSEPELGIMLRTLIRQRAEAVFPEN
jgi:hypothetical protein